MAERSRRVYCTKCGALVRGEERFCTSCGSPVLDRPLTSIPRRFGGVRGLLFGSKRRILIVALVAVLIVGVGAVAYNAVGPGRTGDCVAHWADGTSYTAHDLTQAECNDSCKNLEAATYCAWYPY